jgi:uncharacterized lipoprotein YmbA
MERGYPVAGHRKKGSAMTEAFRASADTRALVVNLTHLELPSNGELTIDGTWTLVTRRPDHIVFTQQATLRAVVTGTDVDAKAVAMSKVLGKLADQIAGSMDAR